MSDRAGYGAMIYQTENIGDEIQSVAAMRFLPEQIDAYIVRDRTDRFVLSPTSGSARIKLIMNGWWTWRPKFFAPSACIDPLLISMYFRPDMKFTARMLNYLAEHGPVGCRDLSSLELLRQIKAPAYFSGCLTLTLQRNQAFTRDDYILAVDLPDSVIALLKKSTSRPVYSISPLVSPIFSPLQRLEVAKAFLFLYQQAHCVVTSRLHAAMPSLALETPVLLLKEPDHRLLGLRELVHNMTVDEYLANPALYQADAPPPNPESYLPVRESLIQKCFEFTGKNNHNSLLGVTNPLVDLVSCAADRSANLKRALWRIKKRDQIKNIFTRLITRQEKYDLYW